MIAGVAGYTATPAAGQRATPLEGVPHRRARLTVELGAFDDPVLGFSRVADLALGPDGFLYVVQPLEASVTVLTQQGELVRRIGQRGQGPGEFQSPVGIGWHGSLTWVLDAGARRVTYFEGNKLTETQSYFGVWRGDNETLAAQLPLSGGLFLGLVSKRPDRERGIRDNSVLLVTLDQHGEVVDTVGALRESYPPRIQIGTRSTSALFHDFPLFRVSRSGTELLIVDRPIVSDSENRITLTKINAAGDTVLTRLLSSPPMPLTNALWRLRLAERNAVLNQASDESREEYLRHVSRPPSLAGVSSVVLGTNGWTWLAREDVLGANERTWVALDETLEPRFSISLPAKFRLFDATQSELWGVSLDEWDVPYVQRWTVVEGRQ